MLKVLLLGSPELFWNEVPIQISRRIPRTILYYLAAHTNPVSREELQSIFWPEEPEQGAREQFRDNLAKLRSGLPDPSMVIAEHQTVRLNPEKVYCDVIEYLHTMDRIGRKAWQLPNDTALPDEIYSNLSSALSLWRTPGFIVGASLPDSSLLDDWLTQTEQNLLHVRGISLNRLREHSIVIHDHIQAIHWLELSLQADPYNEDFHLKLMQELDASGNRNEAIKHGEYVSELFFKEYGEKPSTSISALTHRLRKEKPVPRILGIQNKPLVNQGHTFVGHENELKRLAAALRRNKTVIVRGESGIGKTRLISEFVQRINPAPRVLVMACHPATIHLSYQPLIEMVRISLFPDEYNQLNMTQKRILTQIAPELDMYLTNIDNNLAQKVDTTPKSIREIFISVFSSIARGKKVFLILEDAQWVDEATVQILQFLAQKEFFIGHAALVISLDQGESNTSLKRLIDQKIENDRGVVIDLPALNYQETAVMITDMIRTKLDDGFIERIFLDTGGNPQMIQEIIRLNLPLIESSNGKNIPLEMPGSVQAMLRHKYQRLTDDEKNILSLTAVSGPQISIELLEMVSQINPNEIVEILDKLDEQGILAPIEDQQQHTLGYGFIQKAFRDVILMDMSSARKRLLHRRIAHSLETGLAAEHRIRYAILAEHFEACGESLQAYKYWKKSSEFAKRKLANDEEITAYRHIEYLLPLIEYQLTDLEIRELFNEWSDLAFRINQKNLLERIGNKLCEIGQKRGSMVLQAVGMDLLAGFHFAKIHYQEGLVINSQALRFLDKKEYPLDWMEITAHRSEFLYMMGKPVEALKTIQEVSFDDKEVNSLEEMKIKALAHYDSAVIHTIMGYPAVAIEQSELALQYYIQTENLIGQADSYSIMVLALYYAGEFTRAEIEAEAGLAIARRIDYKRAVAYLTINQSMSKQMLGKLDEAWNLIETGIQLGRENYNPEAVILGYRTLGDLYSFLGNSNSAIASFNQGLNIEVDSFVKIDILARLGCEYGRQKDIELSQKYLSSAKETAGKIKLNHVLFNVQLYEILNKAVKDIENEFIDAISHIKNQCESINLYHQALAAEKIQSNILVNSRRISESQRLHEHMIINSQPNGDYWAEIRARSMLIKLGELENSVRKNHLNRVKEMQSNLIKQSTLPQLQTDLRNFINSIDKIIDN